MKGAPRRRRRLTESELTRQVDSVDDVDDDDLDTPYNKFFVPCVSQQKKKKKQVEFSLFAAAAAVAFELLPHPSKSNKIGAFPFLLFIFFYIKSFYLCAYTEKEISIEIPSVPRNRLSVLVPLPPFRHISTTSHS